MVRASYAEGRCSRCGRTIMRPRPANIAVCDCYRYCPQNHDGSGAYSTEMQPYVPDLTPSTYGPIETVGKAYGDLKHPMKILYVCPVCQYHSAQQPVEVALQ